MREDWIECTIEDVGQVITGGTPSKKKPEFYSQDDYPFYKPTDLNAGIDVKKSKDYLSTLGYASSRKAYKNSILVTCIGATIGKTGLIKNDGAFNQQINALLPFEGLSNIFLYYQIIGTVFQQQIKRNAHSTTLPILNKSKFLKLKLKIAPFSIQKAIIKKIEELFSSLNSGIADLKKAQDQLVIYRQAVLKKAFEGELTKDWREKQTNLPTADELLEQIKEERQKHYEKQIVDWKEAVSFWEKNGKEVKKPAKPQKHKEVEPLNKTDIAELAFLPKKWKWIKNNELMYYVTSGSRDWKKFYSDTKGTYFVRTGDIKTNKLNLNGAAFVDLPKNVEGKRSLIEKGDLLMTITGANVGKIAHVDFEISEAYVSQSVALLKYVLKSFSPYLHYYFQSSATGAKFIGAMVYGVGRPVLSLDNMRDAPVSVCSFEEQHQIVQEIESRLSVCDKVEESITESLAKAQALRQSILKKAFEGTLLSEAEIAKCKADKEYEPASVLLERIKREKV